MACHDTTYEQALKDIIERLSSIDVADMTSEEVDVYNIAARALGFSELS